MTDTQAEGCYQSMIGWKQAFPDNYCSGPDGLDRSGAALSKMQPLWDFQRGLQIKNSELLEDKEVSLEPSSLTDLSIQLARDQLLLKQTHKKIVIDKWRTILRFYSRYEERGNVFYTLNTFIYMVHEVSIYESHLLAGGTPSWRLIRWMK